MDTTDSTLASRLPHPAARDRWAWGLGSVAAVAFVAVGWPVLAAVHGIPVLAAMVLSTVQAAALPVTVRWPRAGIGLAGLAAFGTQVLTTHGGAWPWPVTTLLAYVGVVLLVSLREPWRLGAAAWLTGMVLTMVSVVLAISGLVPRPEDAVSAWGNTAVYAGVGSGLLALGSAAQVLWHSRTQLRAERRLTAAEQARRQELQQRNRIAQELHDVVAHSMSVISVQATTAPYRLPDLPEPVRQEFASIADSSRQALQEMRGLLAVLRGDDGATTAPQPGLSDIPALVEASRASGARVELEFLPSRDSGSPAAVPPAIGLTAYRIVQEAVANALRHAPGAPVSVWVESEGRDLAISVFNGPARDAGSGPASGAGLGLRGMRDRALALGGTLRAAPTPEGGFTVTARLPLG